MHPIAYAAVTNNKRKSNTGFKNVLLLVLWMDSVPEIKID